jgi:hypothetical protein
MSRVLDSSISRSPKYRNAEMALTVISPLGQILVHVTTSHMTTVPFRGFLDAKAPDLLSSGLPESRLPKSRYAYAPTFSFFHVFRVSNAERLGSLVLGTPNVPNSEMTTNTLDLHDPCFSSVTSGFHILGFPEARFSQSLLFGFPGIRNTDILALLPRVLPVLSEFLGFHFQNFATPTTLILCSLESLVSKIPVDSPISSTCPPQMDGPDRFGTSPVAKPKDSLLCFPMSESPI